jgi:hypothetical protein
MRAMGGRDEAGTAFLGIEMAGTKPGHRDGAGSARRRYALMSTSLVSGRKITATTKLIAAMAIGYHRPE